MELCNMFFVLAEHKIFATLTNLSRSSTLFSTLRSTKLDHFIVQWRVHMMVMGNKDSKQVAMSNHQLAVIYTASVRPYWILQIRDKFVNRFITSIYQLVIMYYYVNISDVLFNCLVSGIVRNNII